MSGTPRDGFTNRPYGSGNHPSVVATGAEGALAAGDADMVASIPNDPMNDGLDYQTVSPDDQERTENTGDQESDPEVDEGSELAKSRAFSESESAAADAAAAENAATDSANVAGAAGTMDDVDVDEDEEEALEDHTVVELQELIDELNEEREDDDQLPRSGNKAELVQRVRDAQAE